MRVHTIGFGSKDGGPVEFDDMTVYMRFDEEALKAIAGITEGALSSVPKQPLDASQLCALEHGHALRSVERP